MVVAITFTARIGNVNAMTQKGQDDMDTRMWGMIVLLLGDKILVAIVEETATDWFRDKGLVLGKIKLERGEARICTAVIKQCPQEGKLLVM